MSNPNARLENADRGNIDSMIDIIVMITGNAKGESEVKTTPSWESDRQEARILTSGPAVRSTSATERGRRSRFDLSLERIKLGGHCCGWYWYERKRHLAY
jgi:hypothetical protein